MISIVKTRSASSNLWRLIERYNVTVTETKRNLKEHGGIHKTGNKIEIRWKKRME